MSDDSLPARGETRRIGHVVAIGLLALLVTGSMSLAETAVSRDGPQPTAAEAPNDTAAAIPTPIGPRRPGAQPANPRYPSSPAGYPSMAPRLRTKAVDTNSAASNRQSGLSEPEATSLMTSQGYTRLGEVRADPNSIWVWQADAIKNGRRVRLGVDYRGNLLELSSPQPQPCPVPGVGFGGAALGVGSRLSEATSCSAR